MWGSVNVSWDFQIPTLKNGVWLKGFLLLPCFGHCLNTIKRFSFLFCCPELKGWVVGGQEVQLRCLLTLIDHPMPCDKVLKQQMLKERKKGHFWLWWCPKQVLWVLSKKWLDSSMGSNEEILLSFFCPLCVQFLLHLIKLISVCKSSHLSALFSLSCRRGEWVSSSVGVSQVKPAQSYAKDQETKA